MSDKMNGREREGIRDVFSKGVTCLSGLAAATVLVLAGAAAANAQSYPDRPVTLIVPFPAGGGTDITARLIAEQLSEQWGQAVVVENRGGAAGIVGVDAAVRAEPDGYTLLIGNVGTQAINPSLYEELPYDPDTAFTPISLVAELPLILLAHPDFPADTIDELLELAEASPGHYQFASGGTGNSTHLAGEVFQRAAGVELMHIPYEGGPPGFTDLLGGRVDLMFTVVLSAKGYVESESLKALAVTSTERSPALPDVPTMAESGLTGAESTSWIAVLGPAGLPDDIVEFVSASIEEITAIPSFQEALLEQGATAVGSTPEELATVIRNETALYQEIIEDLGLAEN